MHFAKYSAIQLLAAKLFQHNGLLGNISVYQALVYNITNLIPARVGGRALAKGDYQDVQNDPLYWFGHGLSYTDYTHSYIKLSATKITKTYCRSKRNQ